MGGGGGVHLNHLQIRGWLVLGHFCARRWAKRHKYHISGCQITGTRRGPETAIEGENVSICIQLTNEYRLSQIGLIKHTVINTTNIPFLDLYL